MTAGEQAKLTARITRAQRLLLLAQEQVNAGNPAGVELFAELISEQADSLAAEAKAAK